MSWFKRALAKLFGAKPEPSTETWPQHLFVYVDGKGLAHIDEVWSDEEAHDLAQVVVAQIVMETGNVVMSRWKTIEKDAFTRDELAAFEAKLTAAR